MMPQMPKPLLVFDTVSLANFLFADATHVLTLRYTGRSRITGQVFDELTSGMRARPKLKIIESLLTKKQFSLVSLTMAENARYAEILTNLGRGESSCIAVAASRGWTMVTDDRAARSRCAELKIPVTGTIGILKAACADKQIVPSEADRILHRMVEIGFYSPVRRVSDLL